MNKELTEQEDDVEQLAKAEYDRRTAMIPIPTSFWLEKEEEYKKWYKRGYKAAQKESSKRVYTLQNLKDAYFEGQCFGIGTDACITFEEFINSLNKT